MGLLLAIAAELGLAGIFGLLVLTALGLPVPEEVTVLTGALDAAWNDGSLVGVWWVAIAGVVVSDALLLGVGRWAGPRLLDSRPVLVVFGREHQQQLARALEGREALAVFCARFFPGLRGALVGFLGAQGASFVRVLWIDLAAATLACAAPVIIAGWAANRHPDDALAGFQLASITLFRYGFLLFALATLAFLLVVVIDTLRPEWLRRIDPSD